jgi:hypothetical protein
LIQSVVIGRHATSAVFHSEVRVARVPGPQPGKWKRVQS